MVSALYLQVKLIEDGQADEVVQETRLWDEGRQATSSMRKKEGLADYRYFPEPDLPELTVTDSFIEGLQVGCGAAADACTFNVVALTTCLSPATSS